MKVGIEKSVLDKKVHAAIKAAGGSLGGSVILILLNFL
jgi:hypothetical protein